MWGWYNIRLAGLLVVVVGLSWVFRLVGLCFVGRLWFWPLSRCFSFDGWVWFVGATVLCLVAASGVDGVPGFTWCGLLPVFGDLKVVFGGFEVVFGGLKSVFGVLGD